MSAGIVLGRETGIGQHLRDGGELGTLILRGQLKVERRIAPERVGDGGLVLLGHLIEGLQRLEDLAVAGEAAFELAKAAVHFVLDRLRHRGPGRLGIGREALRRFRNRGAFGSRLAGIRRGPGAADGSGSRLGLGAALFTLLDLGEGPLNG